MALSKEFENAKSNLELLKSDPGNDAKLKLYAFYKQASIGNCNTTKPNFTDLVNKYKWNAWNNLKNMSKVKNNLKFKLKNEQTFQNLSLIQSDAEKNYIQFVNQLLEKEGIIPQKDKSKFCDTKI